MPNRRNVGKFFRDVDREFDLAVAKETVRGRNDRAIFALTRIIENTPFRTGEGRAAWKVVAGGFAPGVTVKLLEGQPTGLKSKSGARALKAGISKILTAPDGDVTIFNPLKYVAVIDQGGFVPPDPGVSKKYGKVLVSGGFHIHAPRGIVEVSILETKAAF